MRIRVLLLAAFVAVGVAMQPVADASAAGVPTWHVVARGETLYAIGRLHGVSPWAIASANQLASPSLIFVGQTLYIPAGSTYSGPTVCGSYYTVQRGDTLLRIGSRYNVSAWSIAAANRIFNMNRILVGQRLFIPCY